jgi:hypothetical protein
MEQGFRGEVKRVPSPDKFCPGQDIMIGYSIVEARYVY